jgi:small subunit ribosomal protein S4
MARYIGPTCKLARREGADLSLKSPARALDSKCKLEQKPGQHGAVAKRKGQALRLRRAVAREAEGQAHLRPAGASVPQLLQEGVLEEGQHRRVLLQLLETRLDNVVYRMGFAVTRPAARQLVSHRGVTVNGKAVNLPSYQVRPGDAIALTERAQRQLRVAESLTLSTEMDLFPGWVEVDSKKFAGVFKAMPERSDLPSDINEALIVELYSK